VTFAPSYAAAAVWLDSLPHSSVWLGGFSQGAVMAYALGLGVERPRPDAIVAMSGFIPQTEAWEADLSPPLPPIAIAHGIYDPVISVEYARTAKRLLDDAGAALLYREYPIDHTIDPSFLGEARDWLAQL
jgi:phospholipase/carboxylesterase